MCVNHTKGTFYRVSHLALFSCFFLSLSSSLFLFFVLGALHSDGGFFFLFFLVGWWIGYGESCVGN